jgi:hypothetical protein
MVSSGLLRRVALVRTDVSEEPGTFFNRVTKIGELGTKQAATSNRRRMVPSGLLRRENLKSYKIVIVCVTVYENGTVPVRMSTGSLSTYYTDYCTLDYQFSPNVRAHCAGQRLLLFCRSLNLSFRQYYWGHGLCPSSGILES